MRWFTSDIHFWHRNVITYCNRPWATVEEMNAGLIERINSLVKPDDEVFCFGDFSLNLQGAEIIKYLNGTWYLVPGNHDKVHSTMHKNKSEKKANIFKKYEDMGFIVLPEQYSLILSENEIKPTLDVMDENKIFAQICHFPFKEDHGNFEQTPRFQNHRPVPHEFTQVLLHGHVHNAWKSRMFWSEELQRFIPQINLGVDAWDWKPVSEVELLAFCKKELTEAREMTKLKKELEEVPDENT